MECQSMVKSHVGLYDAHCNTRCARFTIGPMLKLYHRPEARLVRLRESCAPTVNSCFLRHSPGAGSPRGPIPSIHPPPQTRRHSVWYSRQRTQQQQVQMQPSGRIVGLRLHDERVQMWQQARSRDGRKGAEEGCCRTRPPDKAR